MIKIENVSFSYDDKHPVLTNLSVVETEPVITCLWGKNGSGKTTLMKLLAGHQKPSEGTIRVMGQEPYNNIEVSENICYMQEDHPFSTIWTVQDAIRFGSYFYKNWNQQVADKLIEAFSLPKTKKVTKLSKGMKSALQIAIGLASFADITVFDEPTNGLDAAMRKVFFKELNEISGETPRLFLISTHHIEEIQSLCESLIVIHDRNVLLHEPMDDVRSRGIWVAGEAEKVMNFIEDEEVLEQVKLGKTIKVMVDIAYNQAEKQRAMEAGLSLEKAELQDYLLSITEKKKELIG